MNIGLIDRVSERNKVINFLNNFYNKNITQSKGLYVCGEAGCGKTEFVINLLNELNYDIIRYDTNDNRSKNIIELLNNKGMSSRNVTSFFTKKESKIIIVIDDIDSLNINDKNGINSLIKLVRIKKTQKQKIETESELPIIFIGKKDVDKKNKELMKVCEICEVQKPERKDIDELISKNFKLDVITHEKLIDYIDCDIRKLNYILSIIKKNTNLLDLILNIVCDDTNVKKVTQDLFKNNYRIKDHQYKISDTDRTIVGLLWHENIIDILSKVPIEKGIILYYKFLENICYADFMDRITFQKQIWQFNEITSIIKTMYNNYIMHNNNIVHNKCNVKTDIRFTKVLTKYSTEYNNLVFIHNLCQELNLDKKDMLGYFWYLKKNGGTQNLIDCYDITELDINRIFRYIEFCL